MKIDKNIPIPENQLRCNYILDMEINDSVYHEYPNGEFSKRLFQTKIANRYRSFCKQREDCFEWKFSTRNVDGGIRIWRKK